MYCTSIIQQDYVQEKYQLGPLAPWILLLGKWFKYIEDYLMEYNVFCVTLQECMGHSGGKKPKSESKET